MSKVKKNTFMLMSIFSLSCIIFIMFITACSLTKYEKQKVVRSFSDNHVVLSQIGDGQMAGNVLRKVKSELVTQRAIYYNSSDTVAMDFTEKFFNEIGVTDVKKYKQDEAVAVVNRDFRKDVFLNDDTEYIVVGDAMYRVIGFYEEEALTKDVENMAYVNIDSNEVKQSEYYSCMLFDVKDRKSADELIDYLQSYFPDANVEKWNGMKYGRFDDRESFSYFFIFAGFILLANCVSFTKIWTKGYRMEIGVRRVVGISLTDIKIWLIKKYALKIVISCMIATLVALVAFYGLGKFQNSTSLRYLFGTHIHFMPVLSSWLLVSGVGIMICYCFVNRISKNNMLNNIRGR